MSNLSIQSSDEPTSDGNHANQTDANGNLDDELLSNGSRASQETEHNLQIDTTDFQAHNGSNVQSETSSIVPTSARLSIATTTHPAFNMAANTETIGTMLDSILTNPGWSVAAETRRRRNSLLSMRSLVPTLPPYEDHLGHHALQNGHPGPSNLGPGLSNGTTTHNEKSSTAAMGASEPADPNAEASDSHHPVDQPDPDPENNLSAHYSRIVRTLDSRYTSELERLRQEDERLRVSHAEDVALMRNNLDAAYRDVLKKRDREVERAREEVASRAAELEQEVGRWKEDGEERFRKLEDDALQERVMMKEAHAREMERARNAVEDVWERRWRDRMGLVDEEGRRRVKERDLEWLAFLRDQCPDILETARIMMEQPTDI